MGTYFYRVNTNHPVLKDKRIRLALAYALNRQLIVDKVSKCGQLAAYSFTPPGTAGYEPDTSIPFDPDLAGIIATIFINFMIKLKIVLLNYY